MIRQEAIILLFYVSTYSEYKIDCAIVTVLSYVVDINICVRKSFVYRGTITKENFKDEEYTDNNYLIYSYIRRAAISLYKIYSLITVW